MGFWGFHFHHYSQNLFSIHWNFSQYWTLKAILFDGSLREYEKPIRAEEILVQNPDHFICDSDSLYVDCFTGYSSSLKIASHTVDTKTSKTGEVWLGAPSPPHGEVSWAILSSTWRNLVGPFSLLHMAKSGWALSPPHGEVWLGHSLIHMAKSGWPLYLLHMAKSGWAILSPPHGEVWLGAFSPPHRGFW